MLLPDLLRLLQDLSGLTQTELARQLGVSFVAFNRWINGQAKPRKGAAARIEALLQEHLKTGVLPDRPVIGKKSALVAWARSSPSTLRTLLDRPDLLQEFELRLTYTSNRIEGSTLTEAETAAVIFDDAAVARRALADQIAAKNHQAALRALFRFVEAGESITEEFVLRLHAILMNGLRDDAGQYRSHGVRIVGSNIPTANPLSVPRLMTELVASIEKSPHDAIAHAADIHAQFEKIHPFADGNGRVGRLLLHMMLFRANLPPSIIRSQRKRAYYAALQQAQSGGGTEKLEIVICDGILDGRRIVEKS